MRVDVDRRTADLTVRVEAARLQEGMRPVAEVDEPRLRTEIEQEAAYQVRRLRNHACMALSCGNISTFATATWQRSPFAGLSRPSPTTSCGRCPVLSDRSIEGAPREHDQAQRG